MQDAQNEQHPAQPTELAQLPSIITAHELAAALRVPAEMLQKLVAGGKLPRPVVEFQRTKRWSRDAVLAALGGVR